MQIFYAVFDCSNCADKEKNKSNYRFPSFVENNGKKILTLSKVRRAQLVWLEMTLCSKKTSHKIEKH